MRSANSEPAARVLIVDDDRNQADLLARMLALEGFETLAVYAPSEALTAMRDGPFSVVISDFNMPEMNGIELFRRIEAAQLGAVFIVITAFGTLETAVEAMKEGVQDFVTKPVDVSELTIKIRKALRLHDLEAENRDLKGAVEALRAKVRLIGDSEQMRLILQQVHQVSQSPATVLIRGESGTGKELIARAIHLESPRHAGPYVAVNCAAIPESLIEAELFGHVKGAFTGAVGDRTGRFATADGGTLLLDEIGDLPLPLQPKLLRVLQEREVEPVGASEPVPVDVRLIAATHRDLGQMVADGEFREDLFYRLSVIPLEVPALRDRSDDVLPLAHHFLRLFCEENVRRISGFTREAEERLRTYSWPGNVRELENCVERAVVLCPGDVIDEPDLMLQATRRSEDRSSNAILDVLFDTALTLDHLERDIIVAALRRCGGNLSRTARTLGLTRRALQYRVEKIRREEESGDTGGGVVE
ncbi:MAG: sigma-54-dependent Fis family transcriptional regulator [Planctomycetes bacterium]|nr:sigma-54-dependent Fis family transcriptional regulator [Planctomycetota bacterium]